MAEAIGQTRDMLLGGRVRLVQPAAGYRAAIDPVLLAAATPAGEGEIVLDAGCGTGAATICLAARVAACRIIGLELRTEAAAAARETLRDNELDAIASVLCGDLADPPEDLRRLTFDHVMSNPPYLSAGHGTAPATADRAGAHVETMPLPAWIAACLLRLRPGGWLTLIHRADRLPGIAAALESAAGDVTVLPLWPTADAPAARRVIVRARRGSKGAARLLRGLVLHEADGRYTAAAEDVLRGGAGLEMVR